MLHTTLMAVVPTGAGMLIDVPFWLVNVGVLMVMGGFCTATVTERLAVLALLATSLQTMVWVSLKPLNRLERVTKWLLVPPAPDAAIARQQVVQLGAKHLGEASPQGRHADRRAVLIEEVDYLVALFAR